MVACFYFYFIDANVNCVKVADKITCEPVTLTFEKRKTHTHKSDEEKHTYTPNARNKFWNDMDYMRSRHI